MASSSSSATSNNLPTTIASTVEPPPDQKPVVVLPTVINGNNGKEENGTTVTVRSTMSAGAAAAAVSAGLVPPIGGGARGGGGGLGLSTTTTTTAASIDPSNDLVAVANNRLSEEQQQQQDKANNAGPPPPTTMTNTKEQTSGDPGYANALLSLGQDLTKSQSLELFEATTTTTAATSHLPPQSTLGVSPLLGTLTTITTTEAVANIRGVVPQTMIVGTTLETSSNGGRGGGTGKQQKRKHSETVTTTATTTTASTTTTNGKNDDSPVDFWYWLPLGQEIGDWDVLCGRGGESNNYAGNKRYRRVVNERKEDYRKIELKHRKMKTAFVRDIVQHINNCGGRFVDIDDKSGKYYVVTMEKARKKTSQALRETKELKWLEIDETKGGLNGTKKKSVNKKDVVCPFCNLPGHKTRIASACLKHHEWLDASKAENNININNATADQAVVLTTMGVTPLPSQTMMSGSGGVAGSAVPPTQKPELPFLLPKDPLELRGDDPSLAEPSSSTTAVATADVFTVGPESIPPTNNVPAPAVPFNDTQIPMTTEAV